MTKFIMTDEQKAKIGHRDEIEFWDKLVYRGMNTNYAISTLGRVKRIKKYSKNHPDYVAPYKNRNGYLQVQLRINNKSYLCSVHRLVALTFIKIPKKYTDKGLDENDLVVNHINGLRYDPYVRNLEWCTSKENTRHAIKNNLRHPRFGSDHPNSVLDENIVNDICKYLEKGYKNIYISKKLNVSYTLVNQIKNGSIWKRISSKYNIKTSYKKKYTYLSESKVYNICEDISNGLSNKEISKKYDLPLYRINNIRRHKRWNNISKKFNF